jgi:hypothetical protein
MPFPASHHFWDVSTLGLAGHYICIAEDASTVHFKEAIDNGDTLRSLECERLSLKYIIDSDRQVSPKGLRVFNPLFSSLVFLSILHIHLTLPVYTF